MSILPSLVLHMVLVCFMALLMGCEQGSQCVNGICINYKCDSSKQWTCDGDADTCKAKREETDCRTSAALLQLQPTSQVQEANLSKEPALAPATTRKLPPRYTGKVLPALQLVRPQ